ncbi:hypothetical protein SY88_14565 [Clostridiales bacterium PH28_bin88]|nr:hypothetical protein SY88_14565 [Clostridiales bacterium PH28_bin88]
MAEFSLIKFIFQAIPESSGLVAAAMAVMGVPLNWRKIVLLGVLQAVSALVIRQLPVAFGIHTVLLIFLLVLYLRMATGAALSQAFKGVISSFVILIVSEIFSTQLLLSLTQVPIEQVATRPWLMVLFTLPQVVVLFVIALLVNRRNRRKTRQGVRLPGKTTKGGFPHGV